MYPSLEPSSNHELIVELFEKGQFFSKLSFKKSEIIIGRQSENDIEISDKAVSRQHAKIIIENNEIKLVDLGSANGTFVDNEKISVQKVNSLSLIRIGHKILKLTLLVTVKENGHKIARAIEEPIAETELTLSIIVKNIEASVDAKKVNYHDTVSVVNSNFIDLMTQGYIKQGSPHFTGFKLESLVLWNDRIFSMNEFGHKQKIDVGPLSKNAIHIPSLSQNWTLINYDFAEARFIVPQTFPIYVLRGKNFLTQEHLLKEKRIKTNVQSLEVVASAYDVVRIDIDESTKLYVRYIPTSEDLDRKKLMSPDEFVKKAFKFSFVFHLILAVIIMLIPAEKLKEKVIQKSVEHTARIIIEEKMKEVLPPQPEPIKPIEEVKIPEPEVKPPEPPKEIPKELPVEKQPVIVKHKPKIKKMIPLPVVKKVKREELREEPESDPEPIAKQVEPVQAAPVQVEKPTPVVAAPVQVSVPQPPPPPPKKKVDANQLGALAALGSMKLDVNSKNSLPADIQISHLTDQQSQTNASASLNTSALAKDIKADAQSSGSTNHSGPIRTKGKGSNKSAGFGQESLGSETGQRGVKAAVLGKPALKFESSSKLEGLTREQVMKTMQGSMSKIQSCYERSLLADENLSGRIEFEWEIAESGSVTSAEIKKNSVAGGEQLGDCVLQVLRKIQFPKATNGQTTRPSIGFPFGRL